MRHTDPLNTDDEFINDHLAICTESTLSDFSCLAKLDKGIRYRTTTEAWDLETTENIYLQIVGRLYMDWIRQLNSEEYTARYVRRVLQAWIEDKEPPRYPGPEFQEPQIEEEGPFIEGLHGTNPMDLAPNKVAVAFRGPNYEKSTDAIKKDLRRKAAVMGLNVAIWAVPDQEGIIIYSYKSQ